MQDSATAQSIIDAFKVSDEQLLKEVQSEVLCHLTAEDLAFIQQRDALFQELTSEFSCDLGKVKDRCDAYRPSASRRDMRRD